jgi:hypothetical protein
LATVLRVKVRFCGGSRHSALNPESGSINSPQVRRELFQTLTVTTVPESALQPGAAAGRRRSTDFRPIFYSVCWFLTNFPHGCDLKLNLVVPTRAFFFLDSAG